VLNLLKADDVEGRESHQHREQNNGRNILDHKGSVIARLSSRLLVARVYIWLLIATWLLIAPKIEQPVDIVLDIVIGLLAVSISIVTPPELQNLAAAIRTFWSVASHGRTTRNTAFYIKARRSHPRSRAEVMKGDKSA
jgi:hypothetical protein